MTDAPRSFGKYLLEREIARGGMARVHLATLRGLGGFEKRLVVKEILPELASDPKFVAMFVEEAKVLVALSHPNIVPVYELGIVDGTYFLAMEHVDGATLADLVAIRPLTPAEAARVGAEIADALSYAHERFEIVHRDVSPRNVMVDTAGHARLLDFGIAARADLGDGDGDALYGTPGFLSPEQARGEKLGPASDLFALGCVLAFATRGSSPFGPTELERLRTLEAAPDVTIRGAPALEKIVRDLLAPSASARPASARAVARLLAAAATSLEQEESAVLSLAERAIERPARESLPPEERQAAGTVPVTPGKVETLAKSQALDVILGTAKIDRASSPGALPAVAGTPGTTEEPGTAKIERARQSSASPSETEQAHPPVAALVARPGEGRSAAIALSIAAAIVAALVTWNARWELAPVAPIDPVDHGLTDPADIVPIPIEDAGDEDAGVAVATDAGAAPEADAGADTGAARADAAARASATLSIQANPWADITVDGHPHGRAAGARPLRIRVTPGTHTVHAENPARAEDRTVTVAAGETASVPFVFE